MSFLKDFKDELTQAVNELVNMEETEEKDADLNKGKDEAETEEQKNSDDSTEEAEEGITVKEETLNTIDDFQEDSGIDMKVLNELFGSEEKIKEQKEEDLSDEFIINGGYDADFNEVSADDIDLDNLDLTDYLEDDEEENEVVVIEETEKQQNMEGGIDSEMKNKTTEEMHVDEKEQMRAALRGERHEQQDNERGSYTDRTDEETALATEDIAEITKGTMVEGNIVSEGSINVYGKIKGNVACRGKMVVCGTIVGSSRAAEVFTNNAKVNGDITSDGSLKIGNGSVIIGNIYGTSAVIAGAVQGDVDIHGPVVVDGTAVIQGNIRSRSVQINNGAAIEGMVSQCYAEIDYAALFDKTFSN